MIHLVMPNGARRRLRWADRHAENHFGLGLILWDHTGEILDGRMFAELAREGARIECSTDLERRRTAGALALTLLPAAVDAIVLATHPREIAFLAPDPTREQSGPDREAIQRQVHGCGFHGFRLVSDGTVPTFFEIGRGIGERLFVRDSPLNPWHTAKGRAWCIRCFNQENGDNRSIDLETGAIVDD